MNIKGMDKNMQCRGFQFEIGKEYKINTDKPLELCTDTVFHYCKDIKYVHNYYKCNKNNRFFEIEVLGKEVGNGKKYGSNHIKILREIKGEELDVLLGRTNGNTGIFNTGDYNSGHYNSGCFNSGTWNTGAWNTGAWNSGHYNSGSCNSGHRNSGDWNSGSCNSGNCNSGNYNSGSCNSGHYNSGHYNSGNYNSCSYSSGIFCSEIDENIRIFNKPSNMSFVEFLNSEYNSALCSVDFKLTEWVEYTEREKKEDEEKAMIGGYLKEIPYKEACAKWWSQMTEKNKKIIQSIPNFDAKIFKDITGIEV